MLPLILGLALLSMCLWMWCAPPAALRRQHAPTPRWKAKLSRLRARLRRRKPLVGVDETVMVDLLAAALAMGVSIPLSLRALADSLEPDRRCADLRRVARALLLGAPWQEAWDGVETCALVRTSLRPAWEDGAGPVPLLERAASTTRRRRVSRAKEAAARMGARLVLPLGLCFLPAFVILGVVPVVIDTGLSLFRR